MNRSNLIVIANILAVAFAGWAWLQYQADKDLKEYSIARYEECRQLTSELKVLQAKAAGQTVIATENFDPSAAVADAVKSAGLYDGSFTTGENSLGFVKGSNVKRWRISLPEYEMSLRQVSSLIAELAGSPMKFQTSSINLKLVDSRGTPSVNQKRARDGAEKWRVDFHEVTYLKSSTAKR